MLEALTSVAASAVCLVLLIAFGEHVGKPEVMARALTTHRILPGRAARAVAAVALALEGALAAALGWGLVTGASAAALSAALAVACGLLALYAAYSYRALRKSGGRAVPCGCSRADTPLSGWVVFRAGALAALALLAAVRADAIVAPAESATRFAAAALPGAVFAVLLWVLPEAMIDPTRGPRRGL